MKMTQVVHDTVIQFDDIAPNTNESLIFTIGAGKKAYLIVPAYSFAPLDPPPEGYVPSNPAGVITIRAEPQIRGTPGLELVRLIGSRTRVETDTSGVGPVIAPILLTPWADVAPYEVELDVYVPFQQGEVTDLRFFVVIGGK